MSAAYPVHSNKSLEGSKPTAWSCARALFIIFAGAASWVAAIAILMRF